MKIYIGPYKNWIGPYQLADTLRYIGVKEDTRDKIGVWLDKTWVRRLCEIIHEKRQRKIKIRIDKYDTWNMDDTLALIMVPMLKQLKATTHGSPSVDDEDVPENLRSTAAPAKENEYDIDENHHLRWEWVLDELIWTFTQLQGDTDWAAQYESGEHDWQFIDSKDNDGYKEMVKGPNDTYKVDVEGLEAHQKKIDNGLRLFAKYYRGLWD